MKKTHLFASILGTTMIATVPVTVTSCYEEQKEEEKTYSIALSDDSDKSISIDLNEIKEKTEALIKFTTAKEGILKVNKVTANNITLQEANDYVFDSAQKTLTIKQHAVVGNIVIQSTIEDYPIINYPVKWHISLAYESLVWIPENTNVDENKPYFGYAYLTELGYVNYNKVKLTSIRMNNSEIDPKNYSGSWNDQYEALIVNINSDFISGPIDIYIEPYKEEEPVVEFDVFWNCSASQRQDIQMPGKQPVQIYDSYTGSAYLTSTGLTKYDKLRITSVTMDNLPVDSKNYNVNWDETTHKLSITIFKNIIVNTIRINVEAYQEVVPTPTHNIDFISDESSYINLPSTQTVDEDQPFNISFDLNDDGKALFNKIKLLSIKMNDTDLDDNLYEANWDEATQSFNLSIFSNVINNNVTVSVQAYKEEEPVTTHTVKWKAYDSKQKDLFVLPQDKTVKSNETYVNFVRFAGGQSVYEDYNKIRIKSIKIGNTELGTDKYEVEELDDDVMFILSLKIYAGAITDEIVISVEAYLDGYFANFSTVQGQKDYIELPCKRHVITNNHSFGAWIKLTEDGKKSFNKIRATSIKMNGVEVDRSKVQNMWVDDLGVFVFGFEKGFVLGNMEIVVEAYYEPIPDSHIIRYETVNGQEADIDLPEPKEQDPSKWWETIVHLTDKGKENYNKIRVLSATMGDKDIAGTLLVSTWADIVDGLVTGMEENTMTDDVSIVLEAYYEPIEGYDLEITCNNSQIGDMTIPEPRKVDPTKFWNQCIYLTEQGQKKYNKIRVLYAEMGGVDITSTFEWNWAEPFNCLVMGMEENTMTGNVKVIVEAYNE